MRKDEDRKTKPWMWDEYLTINGNRYCYFWQNNEIIVAFPGNTTKPLSMVFKDSKKKGNKIIPPDRVREEYSGFDKRTKDTKSI